MRGLRRSLSITVAAAATVLLLVACGGSSKSASTTSAVNISSAGGGVCNYKFALITHGDNGSFWSVVYKGARNAASDLGCKLTEVYGSQQSGQAQPDDNA